MAYGRLAISSSKDLVIWEYELTFRPEETYIGKCDECLGSGYTAPREMVNIIIIFLMETKI